MDGSSPGKHAGRPIKRGRGGNYTAPSARGGRGGAAAAEGATSSFRRKLAGTPLFRLPDDSDAAAGTSEDSGEELPASSEVWAKRRAGASKSSKMAKDDALYNAGAEKARKTRFETVGTENRYLQLKPLRERERRDAIASGLIPDPLKPRKLDDAIAFQATCTEMCPEFEREEREYQKNVDRWEMTPGTNRIDRQRAVKAFHRPAAGNDQPLPSDVRPPEVLKKTLDYLFHDIIAQDPDLAESHPFLRDRTRAIRQDFTLQNDRGSLAIECHERIARYHILCLHVLRENENFSESQELEQLRKVLQSLNEFYEDARHEGRHCPHEAEFRAYYLITHLRDSDTIRQIELLPREIFSSEHLQAALRLHALAQRNNETRGERGRRPANSEASLNAFSRFFKAIASDETSYLLACLAETHFADIRRGALVCLRKAYMAQHPECPLPKLTRMLGCDNTVQCAEICENFGFAIAYDEKGLAPIPTGVILHRGATMIEYPPTIVRRTSHKIVGAKLGTASFQAVVDGEFYSSHIDVARAKRHISKKPSISRRGEKSVSPRTSLKMSAQPAFISTKEPALPTPPISLPPSPSLTSKKPPLALINKGLNARAPSFSPSAFATKQSTPVPAHTQSTLTPTASSSKAIVPERPTLSVIQHSPVPQPSMDHQQGDSIIESRRTRTASPKSVSKTAPAPMSASTPAQSAGRGGVIDLLTARLMESLLQQCLAPPIRNIAAEGLGQAHAEQRAMLDSERNRVVDVCAGGLLENTLKAYSLEVAREISVDCQCNRNRMRRSLTRWKRALEKVQAAKLAKEKRKRNFQALSSRLGASPHKGAADKTLEFTGSPNQTFADLMPDPFVEEDNLSMQVDTSRPATKLGVTNSPATRHAFWQRDTLAIFICDLVNKAFSTYHVIKPPAWKVLAIVPSLSDSIASWYRCKLGLEPMEDQRIDRMPYVGVEFVVLTEQELHDENLDNVGLVIVNVDKKGLSEAISKKLERRLLVSSRYCPPILQVDWSSHVSKLSQAHATCRVDTNDANGGLTRSLNDMLQQVYLNNSVRNRLSASQIVSSFLEIWRSCGQTLLAALPAECETVLLKRVLQVIIGALRDLPEHIEPFLMLSDERNEIAPPAFDVATGGTVSSAVQAYLEKFTSRSNLLIDLLSVRLKRYERSPVQMAIDLSDGLSSMMQEYLSRMPVDKEATLTELQNSLAWWKDTLIDQTADLLQEAARANALPAKKRRRGSAEYKDDDSSHNEDIVASKRVRETAEQAWAPERLSSLTALLAQARELLSDKA